jgi:hypothetical protein
MLSYRGGAPILPARILGSDRIRDSLVRRRRVEIFLGRLIPAVTALPGERPREAYERASRDVLRAIRRDPKRGAMQCTNAVHAVVHGAFRQW